MRGETHSTGAAGLASRGQGAPAARPRCPERIVSEAFYSDHDSLCPHDRGQFAGTSNIL